jgi:hypothetical protein
MASRAQTVVWLLAGMLFGPPALMSVYLLLSRWPTRWFTGGSDWLAHLVSVGVGVVCIGLLPLPGIARGVLALLYAPLAVFAVLMYSLYFVCMVFGDCV